MTTVEPRLRLPRCTNCGNPIPDLPPYDANVTAAPHAHCDGCSVEGVVEGGCPNCGQTEDGWRLYGRSYVSASSFTIEDGTVLVNTYDYEHDPYGEVDWDSFVECSACGQELGWDHVDA